ncbi:MAG: sugar ABC transporter permease [Clostridia bacterium]|nr:sugar ABC transporter permease [Clostridia bacterium]
MVKAKRWNETKKRDAAAGLLMILPCVLFMTVFVMIPLVFALYRSLLDYRVYSDVQEWVGLKNYIQILSTELFMDSFKNVLLLTAFIVLLMVIFGFFFAHVLKNLPEKVSNTVKVIIYIPGLISGMAASIIFLFLTNYSGGLINGILSALNKDIIAFDREGIWPYISIIFPSLWLGFGYNCLVLYAGLLNIPKTYYEAAALDGASAWDRLWHITLPNMKNYFVLIIVNLVASNMQMFEIPLMMTGGGPLLKTYTPVLYVYNSYRDNAATQSLTIAAAVLIMIPIALVNLIVFKVIKSEKSSDD